MSVEEKVKRGILIKELAKDELLAHCIIKIHDSTGLFCGAYLYIACADANPDGWGHMSLEHRRLVAMWAVEALWSQIPKEDQDEWLEIVESWTKVVVKKKRLTLGDAARAMIRTKNTKAMAKEMGISYDVAYRRIMPMLTPFETMEKLQPIFDTRTPHQRTAAHLQEPQRIYDYKILGCIGAIGRHFPIDAAGAAFYEWYENFPERKDYPDARAHP